jgi:beta-glucosidase-like glycosyl hydrolase/CubicO group peptidase (beta-lactamase class C family)
MRNNLLQIAILSLLFLTFSGSHAGRFLNPDQFEPAFPVVPPFLGSENEWVDSVMETLSLEDQIAQMIMIWGYSNQGPAHERSVLRQISRYKVGGILFFQGEPLKQATLTNRYQQASEIPLLIAIDGENGLGMRLQNTLTYPSMMTLGAISDNSLIYNMGKDIALQLRRLGVHMNFAPVADVNNNPSNPVIGTRSFGEDRRNVAEKVIAYMHGMQDQHLLVAAKHFPGHGDTGSDSHRTLPIIPYGMDRLDSLELYPFQEAIDHGLTGIMVAHLQVPAIDDRTNRATTLSRPAITSLLRERMKFQGLIVTDALNMKGISNFFEPGIREVEAIKAGNDILLMPSDVGTAIQAVKKAVRQSEITEEQIRQSCRKILLSKYWTGLAEFTPVETASLMDDLNRSSYQTLKRELIAHSLTLVKNSGGLIPLNNLDKRRIATVTITSDPEHELGEWSDLYLEGVHYVVSPSAGKEAYLEVLAELQRYNTVVVHVLNTSTRASQGYGISDETVRFVEKIDPSISLILNVAGLPYALGRFSNLDHVDAVIVSYKDEALYQQNVIQGIFGGISFTGTIPVSAGELAAAGTGASTASPIRLAYGEPEDVGLDRDTLNEMEGIIRRAIRSKAMPGCQVLVARKGKIVWHKAYGHHTYQRRQAVRLTDLYDLASITKIASTTTALMRLRDLGKFHEDSVLGDYDPIPDDCNKSGLLIADVLSHQSGMEAWIPFYYNTLETLDTSQQLISRRLSYNYPFKLSPGVYANRNIRYRDGTYETSYSPDYPFQVAENLFMRNTMMDSVFSWIYESGLHSRDYRYSGLGFYMFHQIIENLTDTTLHPYMWYNFYAPLGATTLGYLPLNRFPENRIVPTENDLFFRRQLLRGYVHDMGAAMLGGVSGNAGLFSNANDLAKMMQMYLNGGWYGDRRFLEESTLARYTSCYNPDEKRNRRGLGFDRPVVDLPDEGPACDSASPESFGHSGFTGTFAWVDPAYDLIYIFLSNRVHPNQGNNRLIDMNTRTAVQQVIYNAIEDNVNSNTP